MKKQQLTASITSSDGIGFPLSQIARHLPPPTCCLRATASPPPTPPLRFFFPINSFARPAGNCSLCSLLLSFCVCVCVCVFVCGGGGGLVCLCARAAPHTQKQKKKLFSLMFCYCSCCHRYCCCTDPMNASPLSDTINLSIIRLQWSLQKHLVRSILNWCIFGWKIMSYGLY